MIPATDHYLDDPNSRILMERLLITQPATQALEEALIVGAGVDNDTVTGICTLPALPRSQTLLKTFNDNKTSFNVDELTQATKPIVEGLATFPIMEWSFGVASSVEIDKTDDYSSENAESPNTMFTKSIVGAPHEERQDKDDVTAAMGKLCLLSSSLSSRGMHHHRQHGRRRRLVRSKALPHLSMLESPFLPLSRIYEVEEPTNVTDFPLSYDIEKWIEVAEQTVSSSSSTTGTTTQDTSKSYSPRSDCSNKNNKKSSSLNCKKNTNKKEQPIMFSTNARSA